MPGARRRARQVGPGPALPNGRLTFVFTDIEGSTRLLAQLRDRYADVLERHATLVRSAAERNGGVEVDTQGDSFFLAFGSAADAAGFAADASRALGAEPWPDGTSVRVRIGLHTGEAQTGPTGYIGMDVHRAARIAAAAHGGQVVLSGTTAGELKQADGRVAMRDIGSYRLKDLPGAEPIWQLDWDGVATEFPPLRTLDAPEPPPEPGEPPFQGLEAFDVADADRFFGREALTGTLLDHLRERPVLAVVGASGSGKSSVARAGIVAAVLRDPSALGAPGSWACRLLTPGADPPASLSAALTPPPAEGTGLLLVVDQLEELYTLCDDGGRRASFADRLLALVADAALPVKLVVTLRADFYHRLAEHAGLREAVAASQAYIGPMTRAELRRAIEGPAEAGDWTLVPGLVDLLVHDTGDEPGALPLLSHALLETWNRRRGRTMTLKGYTEAGGVAAAIARTADRLVLETFGPEQQAVARRILLRLTEPGEGTRDTRRRATLEEVVPAGGDAAAVAAVVGALAAARLVTVGDNSLEVAHEALIEEWPTLREWLEEDREGQRTHRRLTDVAREWARLDRDPELLARGSRLAQLTEWADAHAQDLNDEEAAFVHASVTLRDAEAEERETRQRRELEAAQRLAETEHRAARRLRRRAAVLGIALVVAVAAMGAAVWQTVEADRQASEARLQQAEAERQAAEARRQEAAAEQATLLARAQELTAFAISALDEDPTLSKLLALAAASSGEPPIEAIAALHGALAADATVGRYEWPADHFEDIFTDLDPTGRFVVATSYRFAAVNDRMSVADFTTGSERWSWDTGDPTIAVGRAYFTPSGEHVVAGVYRPPFARPGHLPDDVGGVYIFDAETGRELDRVPMGPCGGMVSDVSETHAAVAVWDAVDCRTQPDDLPALELVSLETGRRDRLSDQVVSWDSFGVLTPDGRHVAFDQPAARDPGRLETVVHDVAAGEAVARVDRPELADFLRDISPDASKILFGDPVRVRIVGDDAVPIALETETTGVILWAEFDRTGERIVGVGRNAELRVWDAATGEQRVTVGNAGNGRASSVDGPLVLVSRADSPSALLVDTSLRSEAGAVDAAAGAEFWPDNGRSHPCRVGADTLRIHGDTAVYLETCGDGYSESNMHVVDVAAATLRYSLPHAGGLGIAISPDGRRFARQEQVHNTMGPIRIHDVGTGAESLELEGLCRWDNGDYSAEGLGTCRAFPARPFPLWASKLRWSPDGSMIAALDQGNSWFVAVWSTTDGRLLSLRRTRSRAFAAWDAIFTPDSRQLVVSFAARGTAPAAIQGITLQPWRASQPVPLPHRSDLTLVGFVDGGRTLLGLSDFGQVRAGSLHWLDAATFEPRRAPLARIHEASMKSATLNADGRLLATGDSDGIIRVWDSADGSLVHEVRVGKTEVQGLAFVDNEHLAVTTRTDGVLRIYTLDPGRLLDIARMSLTRGLSEHECNRFKFGDDCPTLAELRGG